MQAFWVSDENEVYAANSIEEAVAIFSETVGEPPEDGFPRLLTDLELDHEYQDIDEDEKPTGQTITIRQLLSQATTCGYLCGGPY